jgi:hypothetical protein
LVRVKGGTHLFDMGSVTADRFMQLIAGDAEFFGPIGDVRRHLGVDDAGVVRTFGVIFMESVRFVGLRAVVVLRHDVLPHSSLLQWMCRERMRMYRNRDCRGKLPGRAKLIET